MTADTATPAASTPGGYTEKAMDHFLNPRNVGRVEDPDGIGFFGDPDCGDYLEVTIGVENERIARIGFRVHGCAGAISTSSAMTCLVLGKPMRDALQLTDDDVISYLGGIPENKRHCSLLGVQALRAAVTDAVLLITFLERGVIESKDQYRQMQKQSGGGSAPAFDHRCDGSCDMETVGE